MIVNIVLILSCLVALNFFLLIFSCNKTTKKVDIKIAEPIKVNDSLHHPIKPEKSTTLISSQLQTRQLAPTGS